MDKVDFFKRLRASETKPETAGVVDFSSVQLVSNPRNIGTPLEAFVRNFTANGGIVLKSKDALLKFLKENNCKCGYIDEKLGDTFYLQDEFKITNRIDRANIDECDFAITASSGAVGEGGMIILKDKDTSDRLATIAPWIHIALIDPSEIKQTIAQAFENIVDNPYTILIAGPSKTADVEGILIEGVHGPGLQVALLLGVD